MTTQSEEKMPRTELVMASREHESILANLLELYCHDFSEFNAMEIGEDGRFAYPHLASYLNEPDREVFVARVDGKLAGFVFVKRGSEISGDAAAWDLAEFFVLRGHRRRGLGTRIAHDVWRMHPGHWDVRVMESNRAGLKFWHRAVAAFAGEAVSPSRIVQGAQWWQVFRFDSGKTSG